MQLQMNKEVLSSNERQVMKKIYDISQERIVGLNSEFKQELKKHSEVSLALKEPNKTR